MHVGVSRYIHVVVVNVSGPVEVSAKGRTCAEVSANERTCAEVLHTLSEGDETGVRDDLLLATIGWHEALIYISESRTNIGRYNTKNGPARATRHFTVPESHKQLQESSH